MSHSTNPANAGLSRAIQIVLTAVLSMTFAATTHAQIVFEEIIVTAQKRTQNLMDVPVAVSAISGQQIEEAGIKDVWDLQQNVPGLLMGRSQTTTSSNFNIRGIGSTSNNFGVESSVGLYVDGVYRSRQSSMINDLIDVEAVEVLRGPQGTLFGKNTAAGAVTVRTVRPGQDRDAFIDLTYGDFGLTKVSAATNIPLSDAMAFRGTVFASKRDGYVDDRNLGKDLYNDRDRMGARLQLAFNEPDDDFNMRVIADYSEIDEVCCIGTPRIDSLIMKGGLPLVEAALQTQNPLQIQGAIMQTAGSDFINATLGGTVYATGDYPDALIGTINSLLPLLSPIPGTIVSGAKWSDYETALNFPPRSKNTDKGLSVEFNKVLTDSITLKSITAMRSFETYDSIDADFSDVDLIKRVNTADQSSLSQEFQFTGEFGAGSSWVGGLYYFGQDLDSTTTTTAGTFFNDFALAGSAALSGLMDLAANTFGLPVADPFPPGANAFDDVRQRHSGWAGFGQVDWVLNDKVTLSLGARYTDETKDIDARYVQTADGPPPDLRPIVFNTNPQSPCFMLPDECNTVYNPYDPENPWPLSGAIQTAIFYAQYVNDFSRIPAAFGPILQPYKAWGMYQYDPFAPRPDVKATLSDAQTTGTAKLTFFPTESTMLYASYATGFKAGGTNSDRINITFNQLFDAETSKSMEVGLKGQYGPVRLVATLYRTDFNDFQANSFSGGGFNLQNAGDMQIKGGELELLWRPAERTEVQAWYTHNTGKFQRFESGTAWDTWVKQYGLWMNPPQGDPGCGPVNPSDLPDSCARTGEAIPYNPEDRIFVALTQEFDLGANTTAFARLEYTHMSEQTTDGDNDPLTLQDGFQIVNARLGLNFDSINSSLTIWGRNVTDERFYYGSFDIPVAEDKMMSYPSEPRTWGVTFHKNFD